MDALYKSNDLAKRDLQNVKFLPIPILKPKLDAKAIKSLIQNDKLRMIGRSPQVNTRYWVFWI